MRIYTCVLLSVLLISCAGQKTVGDREMAPYSAVVVFQWLPDDRAQSTDSVGAAPAADAASDSEEPTEDKGPAQLTGETTRRKWAEENRRWVEDQIIAGLDEHRVFSDFAVADWKDMYWLADRMKADLIVVIRIGFLADWDEAEMQVDTGLAVLSGVLWVGTGIGGLWIQDQVYSTNSDVEVYWKRPPARGSAPREVDEPEKIAELQAEFAQIAQRESVYASGEYNLSLWDRAKIWNKPSAYFTNLICPPSLVPFYDEDEIDHSLIVDALDDVKRDLAQKLRAGSLRSAGSPFLFRLESPANGSVVEGSSATLSFSYRLESGFKEDFQLSGLSALHVELKKQGETSWRSVKQYKDEDIQDVNRKILNIQSIDQSIDGLGPGLNLVRFRAETELEPQWITNTIALNGP